MVDRWMARLSEYVDGELDGEEAGQLERHLATCTECAALLHELRAVAARARALEDRPPARDLWAGIAERIAATRSQGVGAAVPLVDLEAERRRRGLTFSVPQLLAAGIALLLAGAGTVWFALGGAPTGTPVVEQPAAMVEGAPARFVSREYDLTVSQLERVLELYRGELDSTTIRIVEENLAIIDQAIAEARAALSADPANTYLNAHLAKAMRRKVQLLQRTVALVEG